MPTPDKNESRKDFISRCIPIVIHEGTTKDPKQAAAICFSKWAKHKKSAKGALIDQVIDNLAIEAAAKEPTTVQTLIFSKKKFDKEAALEWAKSHKFKHNTVRETDDSWRLRQRPPEDFDQSSFRTITMSDGISAVIGHLK